MSSGSVEGARAALPLGSTDFLGDLFVAGEHFGLLDDVDVERLERLLDAVLFLSFFFSPFSFSPSFSLSDDFDFFADLMTLQK